MSLTTHSLIYYGHTIDEDGYIFDFSEGGAELNAVSRNRLLHADGIRR
jgi:hypothetical protein